MNFNPGPVQLYAVVDNIFGVFQPQHYQHIQVRFGINLIFGGNKKKELNPSYSSADKGIGKSKESSDSKTDDTSGE